MYPESVRGSHVVLNGPASWSVFQVEPPSVDEVNPTESWQVL